MNHFCCIMIAGKPLQREMIAQLCRGNGTQCADDDMYSTIHNMISECNSLSVSLEIITFINSDFEQRGELLIALQHIICICVYQGFVSSIVMHLSKSSRNRNEN